MARPGEVLIKEGEVLKDFETLTPDLVNPSLQITYKRCDGFNETVTGTATFEICTKDPSSTTFDTRFWKVERIGPCEDSDGPEFPPDTPDDPNCKRFRVTQTDSRISRTTLNYTDNKLVRQSVVLTFGETVTVDATDKFEEEVRTRENRGALTIEPLGTCSDVDEDKDPGDDIDVDTPSTGLQVLELKHTLPQQDFTVKINNTKTGLLTIPVELEGNNLFNDCGIKYQVRDVPEVTDKLGRQVPHSISDVQVSTGTNSIQLSSASQNKVDELVKYVADFTKASRITVIFILEPTFEPPQDGSPYGNTDDVNRRRPG